MIPAKLEFIVVLFSATSSVVVAMLLLNVLDGKIIFDALEIFFDGDSKYLLCNTTISIDTYVDESRVYIGDFFGKIFDTLFRWVSSGGVNESEVYNVSDIVLKDQSSSEPYCTQEFSSDSGNSDQI
ncbi:MAG: hypothetical protein ACI9TO_001261 [Rickettsiales bacterium]|jgi:hypothetical protein